MTDEDQMIIRINLQGKHKKMFEDVKLRYNISTNTDAFRLCIEKAYKPSDIEIPVELVDEINSLLRHSNIRSSYNIYNQSDFLKQALSHFVQKLRTERGSLRSFTTRKYLPSEENELAITLLAILDSSPRSSSVGVTALELSEKMDWSLEKVQIVLKRFLEQDYIVDQKIDGKTYYYAPYPGE